MQKRHPLPAGVYSIIEKTPASVLLESGRPQARSSPAPQLSRLFLDPSEVLAPRTVSEARKCLERIEAATSEGYLAAGFMTYECGMCFEPSAALRTPQPDDPLAWFGIYQRCYTWDHAQGRFLDAEPPGLSALQAEAGGAPAIEQVAAGLTEEQYATRIAAIHKRIRAGDVYQLNFTFPLRFDGPESIAALYAELRRKQPVDYGALIHWDRGRYILSYSPELFFRIETEGESRRIITRPMKGTVRRGRTTAEDRLLSEWLRNDGKNRSENVMIVDLLRNDLGRLCEFGSVTATDLFAVERHPTLLQMTSTVSGLLRHSVSFSAILRALFPSGSVTGAPKIRAMQLLGELEQEPRGVYTGMIGFFSSRESVANVAIRTVQIDTEPTAARSAKMGVGSGIVIDSDAAAEFRECLLKSQFLTQAAPNFELIETMLWRGEFPLLELHLDRLEDSADYFGFLFDRIEVRTRLMATAAAMPDVAAHKVRLLLSSDGSMTIASELLPPASPAPLRVCIAQERTDAEDRFYFHKTTNRPLYLRTLQAAQASGFDDVLFLNREGQLTESAVGNLFVEKGGVLFTPPVACGLLAGVFRRHMLSTRSDVLERVLSLEDLKAAGRGGL
jgi:para-aminobenzoate synthetase/4-amino-4-deoxychorismate lyase